MSSSPSAKSQKPVSHSKTFTRRSGINTAQFTSAPPTIISTNPAASPSTSSPPPLSDHTLATNNNVSTKFGPPNSGSDRGASNTGAGNFGIGTDVSASPSPGPGPGAAASPGAGVGGGAGGHKHHKTLTKTMEISLSIVGTLIFVSWWIFMMVQVKCHPWWWKHTLLLFESFAVGGAICCLFVLGHSCLDHRLAIGRGVFGCIIFFLIAIVTFGNIMVGFFAVQCACMCYPLGEHSNAFKDKEGTADLVMFFSALGGAFCLVAILLVASVAR